ncbi:Mannitol-1-phosphate dehydrogenase [Mycena kentingensis (nom. inval.)]|nr:Mannitol-1-phosphate dehydrogenase [Mycena kentingensis (nom. inval.)]
MAPKIPETQTAAVIPSSGTGIELQNDHPVKQPQDLAPGECLVKLECTGVCHTDLHAALDDWPMPPKTPLVGGHEGVGIVVAIGENTDHSPVKLGDRVGIKWLAYSCLTCEQCRKGREQNCPEGKYSGFTVDGTFQQYAVSYVNHVTPIPEGFDSKAAASILCAGLTVFRAIKHSQTTPGDWIVLPGAGGGLGHLAIQYAKVFGLRAIAIDTGAAKKDLCLSLGADKWIDFKEHQGDDLVKKITDITDGLGAHSALVTASSVSPISRRATHKQSPTSAPGVRSWPSASPAARRSRRRSSSPYSRPNISIIGSQVGNRQDAVEALAIAARGDVQCKFESQHIGDLEGVFEGMKKGTVAGRVVLEM